jgi:HEAT repeat protein
MISSSDIVAMFHQIVESDGAEFDVLQDLDPHLRDIELYPFEPLLKLGSEVGKVLEKNPAAATDVVVRMAGSPLEATRALACVVVGRVARHGPAQWMPLARHLAADDNWEVREYAAHIFDTHGDIEGLSAFHLDYCFEVLNQWVRDTDYRVRRATTNALLGYFLRHPDIGERLVSLLEPLLTDTSDYVRRNLVFALRTVGKRRPELVFAFVENHLSDELEGTREVLRQTLNHRWARRHAGRRDTMLKSLESHESSKS